jgi:hypothetical protein
MIVICEWRGQRAIVAAKLANLEHGGDRKSKGQLAPCSDELMRVGQLARPEGESISNADAAKMLNVGDLADV